MALLWLLSVLTAHHHCLMLLLLLTAMAPTVEAATRHHQQQQQQQQHISACSACRMAHGSCPLRSGLFTRSHLHAGLNLVATVPRGACNINVTEMAPSMNRLAVRTHRDSRFVLNGGRGTSDWPGDYAVAGTIVSYTRGAHGRGEALWAVGPLTEAVDIMVMAKQHNPGIHYQYHVPAGPSVEGFPTAALQPSPLLAVPWNQGDVAEDEVAWRVAGLTPCSQSCGGGEQQTVLACMRGLHVTLPPSHCDGLPQPEDETLRCNTKPCPAQWEAGDWGPCSVSCGAGTQTRPLLCRQLISSSLTIKVAEGACLAAPPERSRRCHVRSCPTTTPDFVWDTSPWGACSAACGQGIRTRRVWCKGEQDVEFPDIRCSLANRPSHEESCDAGPCVGNTWFFTDWSQQCSARCGPGIQKRRLHCSGGSANAVIPDDESQCDPRSRPAESRACNGDCGPAWFHGPWEECPDSCESDSVAYQSRSVVCVQWARGQMRVVLDSKCAGLERPTSRRVCPHQPAACRVTWFFSAWGQCLGPCGAGQRTREVQCIDLRLQIPSVDCTESSRPASMETCEPEHCGVARNRSHHVGNGTVVASCGPDKVRNCAAVVQARLCQYPYYRRACCAPCARHDAE